MRGVFGTVLGGVAMAAMLTSGVRADAAGGDWEMGTPIVTYWAGPMPMTDEVAEQMKKLAPADTMGRMKDELGDAASEGRNIEDGLQKQLVFVAKVLKAMKDAS